MLPLQSSSLSSSSLCTDDACVCLSLFLHVCTIFIVLKAPALMKNVRSDDGGLNDGAWPLHDSDVRLQVFGFAKDGHPAVAPTFSGMCFRVPLLWKRVQSSVSTKPRQCWLNGLGRTSLYCTYTVLPAQIKDFLVQLYLALFFFHIIILHDICERWLLSVFIQSQLTVYIHIYTYWCSYPVMWQCIKSCR